MSDKPLEQLGRRTIRVVTGGMGGDAGRFDVHTDVVVGIAVDVEKIAKRLAKKAFNNKGKRATYLNGAIVVEVLNEQPVRT